MTINNDDDNEQWRRRLQRTIATTKTMTTTTKAINNDNDDDEGNDGCSNTRDKTWNDLDSRTSGAKKCASDEPNSDERECEPYFLVQIL